MKRRFFSVLLALVVCQTMLMPSFGVYASTDEGAEGAGRQAAAAVQKSAGQQTGSASGQTGSVQKAQSQAAGTSSEAAKSTESQNQNEQQSETGSAAEAKKSSGAGLSTGASGDPETGSDAGTSASKSAARSRTAKAGSRTPAKSPARSPEGSGDCTVENGSLTYSHTFYDGITLDAKSSYGTVPDDFELKFEDMQSADALAGGPSEIFEDAGASDVRAWRYSFSREVSGYLGFTLDITGLDDFSSENGVSYDVRAYVVGDDGKYMLVGKMEDGQINGYLSNSKTHTKLVLVRKPAATNTVKRTEVVDMPINVSFGPVAVWWKDGSNQLVRKGNYYMAKEGFLSLFNLYSSHTEYDVENGKADFSESTVLTDWCKKNIDGFDEYEPVIEDFSENVRTGAELKALDQTEAASKFMANTKVFMTYEDAWSQPVIDRHGSETPAFSAPQPYSEVVAESAKSDPYSCRFYAYYSQTGQYEETSSGSKPAVITSREVTPFDGVAGGTMISQGSFKGKCKVTLFTEITMKFRIGNTKYEITFTTDKDKYTYDFNMGTQDDFLDTGEIKADADLAGTVTSGSGSYDGTEHDSVVYVDPSADTKADYRFTTDLSPAADVVKKIYERLDRNVANGDELNSVNIYNGWEFRGLMDGSSDFMTLTLGVPDGIKYSSDMLKDIRINGVQAGHWLVLSPYTALKFGDAAYDEGTNTVTLPVRLCHSATKMDWVNGSEVGSEKARISSLEEERDKKTLLWYIKRLEKDLDSTDLTISIPGYNAAADTLELGKYYTAVARADGQIGLGLNVLNFPPAPSSPVGAPRRPGLLKDGADAVATGSEDKELYDSITPSVVDPFDCDYGAFNSDFWKGSWKSHQIPASKDYIQTEDLSEEMWFTFTPAALTIRKKLDSTAYSSEADLKSDREKEFTFKVVLMDKNGRPVSGDLDSIIRRTGSHDDSRTVTVHFDEKGCAEVQLKDGEEIVIPMKDGYKYTVSEKMTDDSFTAVLQKGSSGSAVTSTFSDPKSVSGMIVANGTPTEPAEVTCTNSPHTDTPPDEPNEPETKTVEVSVHKVWSDSGKNRPEHVTVQLFRDGEAFGDSVELGENTDWSHKWTDLEDGHEYTVEEVDVPEGYTSSVVHSGSDWTITNTEDEKPRGGGGHSGDKTSTNGTAKHVDQKSGTSTTKTHHVSEARAVRTVSAVRTGDASNVGAYAALAAICAAAALALAAVHSRRKRSAEDR